MTSGLDTLLEAARYLELQEQQNIAPSQSPPSSIDGRYHLQHYNNNNTNINSGNINNSRSSLRQMSSPPISPNYTSNGNSNNNHAGINRHDFSEFGSIPAVATRNNDGRNEEPYINGHSIAPSYLVISTSSKLQNETPCNSDISLVKSVIATEHMIDYTKNKSTYRLPSPNYNSQTSTKTPYKFIPLTPPPISSRKIEPTRVRSLSLSSNKITANGNGAIVHNGNVHNVIAATAEDSSQSSLNLSSSSYMSGSSANSSVGGCGSNLNLSSSTSTSNLMPNGDHQLPVQTQTSGRRRTTSTNSNGGTQRSPCILRAGTREVHNKLEKHRRAHLKECFEQLKLQLQLKDEEKKKTSNLAILGAAYRHVMSLRRKERELEQQVEQLAKDKINAQKKILNLKRELSAKFDNIDFSNIISEVDIANIPGERVSDLLSDSLSLSSSGRGSVRYSSSSSLSSATTVSSPLGSGMQTTIPTAISPVISMPSHTSPGSPHLKSISPITNSMPLSLTTKNLTAPPITRSSPTPSTPSPSSSGVSSCSPLTSSSPPIVNTSVALKIPNVPNGIKLSPTSSPPNIALVSTAACSLPSTIVNITSSDSSCLLNASSITANSGMPMHLNSSHNVQISSTQKDLTGKNGVCRKAAERRESSPPGVILTNNTTLSCAKEIKMDKVFDESEQPTKVIKLFNGIALAPVDKDNKLLSSTPLALSQVVGGGGLVVSPFPMLTSTPGLRVIGTNGLATIELSTPTVQQSQNRNLQQSQSPTTTAVTSTSGAQLHKLLVSGTTATSVNNSLGNNSALHHTANVASELARLPGGAELNILPTGANGTTTLYRGNGKLAIVNNSITLKGADAGAASGRAVHVVTPIQSGGAPISGLTPIVVSQGQPGSNLAHIIASSPQLAGKVNLSVGGQALPLISTQYLSSMKPMVVAVASNTTPTLSSVPPTPTSATVATGTANGNSS